MSLPHASVADVDPLCAAPAPGHGLGPVADDWEAAEVWLAALARKNPGSSSQTLATYRFHLAKRRWYCERVARLTPSRWSEHNRSYGK